MFPAITLLDPGYPVTWRGNPVLVQSFALSALRWPPQYRAELGPAPGPVRPGSPFAGVKPAGHPGAENGRGSRGGNPAKPRYSTSAARNCGSPVRFASAT